LHYPIKKWAAAAALAASLFYLVISGAAERRKNLCVISNGYSSLC
jgi:hypothetical protein